MYVNLKEIGLGERMAWSSTREFNIYWGYVAQRFNDGIQEVGSSLHVFGSELFSLPSASVSTETIQNMVEGSSAARCFCNMR